MESFLIWLLEQAPVISVMGFFIWWLMNQIKILREEASKRVEKNAELWEKVLVVMTKVEVELKGSETFKESTRTDLKDILNKLDGTKCKQ